MRYPNFLQEKETIGFVAPSLGCATEPYKSCFEDAQKKFREKGYHLTFDPNCTRADGIGISDTPRSCGEELTSSYMSRDSQALISCGGGEMMCEILPYVDFDAIRKAIPKWFMGYSDNTNFTFTSATLADTAAIYAPCVSDFGMEPWHEAVQDAWDLLTGKKRTFHNYSAWESEKIKDEIRPLVGYNPTEPTVIKTFGTKEPGQAAFSGRLIGGCLDCLVNLCGTRFDRVRDFNEKYKKDGIIWFLEACDLNVFGIRRAIWQLNAAGWFEHVRGFLIGRPGCFGEEAFGLDQYHAVTDLLEEYGVPIIMDLDIGHKPPMMPIICGSTANVKVDGQEFTIEYTME